MTSCFGCEEWELINNDNRREIERLRAELDKTRNIINIVHRMQLGHQLDWELCQALKEYRADDSTEKKCICPPKSNDKRFNDGVHYYCPIHGRETK